jgi:hypothetical protein
MSRRGSLRASDQDRDQVVEQLHKAHTEGRIGDDELEQRVSAALKARTYDELEETVADLPGPSRRSPARQRSTAGWALSTVRANPLLLLLVIPVLAVTTAMLLAAMLACAAVCLAMLVIGGRRTMHRGPWVYARRYYYGPPRYGPRSGPPRHHPRAVPPRRRPGRGWI